MSPSDQARALSIGRIIFGTSLFLAPSLVGRLWISEDADRPRTKMMLRGLGIRDAAIGIGVIFALNRDAPVRGWLEAGVLADAGDAAAALVAFRHLPGFTRSASIASATGSAILGRQLSVQLG